MTISLSPSRARGLALALLIVGCDDDAQLDCTDGRSTELAGDEVCVYPAAVEESFECPAVLPMRFDLPGATLCGPSDFEPRAASEAECEQAAIDCSTLRSDGCPGAAPDLADCVVGTTWAECGGTDDEPRFACDRETGACFWFAGDCVAAGYEATPCANDSLCCADGYPFASAFDIQNDIPPDVGAIEGRVWWSLHTWGFEPWDRARDRDVAVTLGDAPDVAVSTVSCSGTSTSFCEGLNEENAWAARATIASDEVFAVGATGAMGSVLWIELARDDEGELGATVCRRQIVDANLLLDAGHPMCSPNSELRATCAREGMVRLAALPDALPATGTQLTVQATFDDGLVIDAALVLD